MAKLFLSFIFLLTLYIIYIVSKTIYNFNSSYYRGYSIKSNILIRRIILNVKLTIKGILLVSLNFVLGVIFYGLNLCGLSPLFC